MLIVGVVAGAGFFLIGLPNPALLGLAAAVGELIPLIGPFLGFLPAVLMALLTDPVLVIPVVIFAVVIQQIEGNVLVPRVMGHTVGISPLTVMLGILIGATLYGLPGAFLAVPVAGAVQVILAHALGMEAPAQAEAHPPPIDERAARAGVRAGAPS
jgi:predicted PurR-regulated permease PerM